MFVARIVSTKWARKRCCQDGYARSRRPIWPSFCPNVRIPNDQLQQPDLEPPDRRTGSTFVNVSAETSERSLSFVRGSAGGVFLVKLRRREGYNDHPFYFQVTATAGLLVGIRGVDALFQGRLRPIVISG